MNFDSVFKQEFGGRYGDIKKELGTDQLIVVDKYIDSFEHFINATLPELDEIVVFSTKIKDRNRREDYEGIKGELGKIKNTIGKVFQNMDLASMPFDSLEIEPKSIFKDNLTVVAFPTVEFVKVYCSKGEKRLVQITGLPAGMLITNSGILGNRDAYVLLYSPSVSQKEVSQRMLQYSATNAAKTMKKWKKCKFPNALGIECTVKTSHGNATVTIFWFCPEIVYEDLDSAGLLCRSVISIIDLVYDSDLGKLLYIPKEGGGVRKLEEEKKGSGF